MKARAILLLAALLAGGAACRSLDPVLVRVDMPGLMPFPPGTITDIIVSDFRDEAPLPDFPIGPAFRTALEADLERAATGKLRITGGSEFPTGARPDDPSAWRAAGAGRAPGTVFLAGSVRLAGEIRKALDRTVPADSPFDVPGRALIAKRIWILEADVRLISASSGESLFRRTFREDREYAELDKPAEFAFHELSERIRDDLLRFFLGLPTTEPRTLLRR